MPLNGRPSVLVLMATRNGSPWIEKQIETIATQVDVSVALAICDDGSTDDTKKKVRKSAAASSGIRVHWVCSTLPGGSASRNFFRLMLAAPCKEHDFVALADQDDLWEPNKLRRAVDELRRTKASAYSSAVFALWPDGHSAVLRQCDELRAADFLFEGAGQGCTFVFRRAAFLRLRVLLDRQQQLLSNLHYHDWTLYALARMTGEKWVFDARPSMQYRQHADNDTGGRGRLAGVVKRLSLVRSGWYGEQVTAMATLCAQIEAGALPESSEVVARFLALHHSAAVGPKWNRVLLGLWVLRNGRRRPLDRLVAGWAAFAGHL